MTFLNSPFHASNPLTSCLMFAFLGRLGHSLVRVSKEKNPYSWQNCGEITDGWDAESVTVLCDSSGTWKTGRYIRIQRKTTAGQGKNTLNFCEVEVYLRCPTGTWGHNQQGVPDCKNSCHCYVGKSCDMINGTCPGNLCEGGYWGPTCDFRCYCSVTKSCNNKITHGECIEGCATGYEGKSCNISGETFLFTI